MCEVFTQRKNTNKFSIKTKTVSFQLGYIYIYINSKKKKKFKKSEFLCKFFFFKKELFSK